MAESTRKIPFEIHLTTNDLLSEEIDSFRRLCKNLGGKPLIIELSRGKVVKQPMFSKVFKVHSTKKALEKTKEYIKEFAKESFAVTRLKIEIPIDFTEFVKTNENNSKNYFEWHGKIEPFETNKLLEICSKHNSHLSKNSIKNDSKRFITIREYGSKKVFKDRISDLAEDLKNHKYKIYKQESEYCVYDSNISLDEGWL